MDNKQSNPFNIDPASFAIDIKNMAKMAQDFSSKIQKTLNEIREDKDGQFTEDQKRDLESKIQQSDIDNNLQKLSAEIEKMKTHKF